MMKHISDSLLERFVKGHLDDGSAVEVAMHLDDCPLCANRAVSLDPLAAAFAAVQDPVPPPELATRMRQVVLMARREPALGTGPLLGLGMLAAALALLMTAGEPAQLAKQIFTTLYALGVGMAVLLRSIPSPDMLLPAVAAAVLFACLSAFHLMGLTRQVG